MFLHIHSPWWETCCDSWPHSLLLVRPRPGKLLMVSYIQDLFHQPSVPDQGAFLSRILFLHPFLWPQNEKCICLKKRCECKKNHTFISILQVSDSGSPNCLSSCKILNPILIQMQITNEILMKTHTNQVTCCSSKYCFHCWELYSWSSGGAAIVPVLCVEGWAVAGR